MRRSFLLIPVLLVAACGGRAEPPVPDNSLPTAAAPSASAPQTTVPSASPATVAPVTLGPATVSGDLGSEPAVTIDTSVAQATELGVVDISVGTGVEVTATSTVTAHYVGYGAMSGQMFDSSWSRGEPATFPLAQVIAGWQQGLLGMKEGGRRLLVIPAELGYGDTPMDGSGIAPGETLVFVVDLVKVS